MRPGPLRRGEKEEHFEGVREVHITGGIDMGCLQNERKGVAEVKFVSAISAGGSVKFLPGV